MIDDDVELTLELIDRLRTPKGGYSKAVVESLGGTWPLTSGWRNALVGKRVPRSVIDGIIGGESLADLRPQPDSQSIKSFGAWERVGLRGVLEFDGSCNPNPGPNARAAFILRLGTRVIERTIPIGEGTCNIAEYRAIIEGMRAAIDEGVTHLKVYGDSELVIRGVSSMKPWKKGKPHLELLKAEAQALVRKFQRVEFYWWGRENNAEADLLSRAGQE